MKYNRLLVKEKLNIVAYVSRYVKLKKAGKNHLGLCPFHAEKTPSFTVSEQKQIFHCFGCAAGGDIVEFLSKYLKIEFYDAVSMLEKESGLKLIERDKDYEKKKAEIDKILEINKTAAAFFIQSLFKTGDGAAVLKYIHHRKLSLEVVKKFYIGYGGKEWDRLARYLEAKGHSKTDIERSGLVVYGSSGRRDFFRNKLMFPIINHRGEVIGFGGRALDDSMPKYINSPEHPVFSKRKNLYGINVAKEKIVSGKSAYIVEGYMDCVAMHQGGYENTVATLGTAVTEEHIRFLKGFVDRFYLIYDGDNAGKKAALRGVEVFSNQGVSPMVVLLPDGEDPDSLLAAGGKAALDKAICDAQNGIDFLINYYKMIHSLQTSDGLRSFLYGIERHVQNIENPLEKELILREVSKAADIAPEKLSGFFKLSKEADKPSIDILKSENTPEHFVVGFLISNPSFVDYLDEDLKKELPSEYFEILEKCVKSSQEEMLSEGAKKIYGGLCMRDGVSDPDEEKKAFFDNIVFLKKRASKKMREDLHRQIREIEQSDRPDKDAVIKELQSKMILLIAKENEPQKRSFA